jgi:kynurenine 3-monooxygenase
MGVYLARAGYRVELYEWRPDPRAGPAARGRSINLALSTRGLAGLAGVGLAERVLEQAVPMRGRMIHSTTGRQVFQPYGTHPDHAIHSVSRADLNRVLIEAAAAHPNVRLQFGQRVTDVDPDAGRVELQDVETGGASAAEGDVLIGADGAFSVLRQRMQRLDRFDYQQAYLEHGYKELAISPGPRGTFPMEPNALHIWPRGGFMMIALPNRDGSFTCTLFWPHEGPHSFASLRTEAQVLQYFRDVFPDAVPLMPTLASDYLANPSSSLVTIRCRPWHYAGRAVLVGDACHAVVPFYGQGANAAFEDCLVLDGCLREHGPDRAKAFEQYETLRKPHVDALADLALANFVEMRDHVGSRVFLLRKGLERVLHVAFPRRFLPLYTMVTFTRIPYAEAVLRARRQDRLLGVLLAAGALAVLLGLAAGLVAVWD